MKKEYSILVYVHSVIDKERVWSGKSESEAQRMLQYFQTKFPHRTIRYTEHTYYDGDCDTLSGSTQDDETAYIGPTLQ